MALIKCPECRGRVSNHADKCPHCGYNISVDFEYNQGSKNKSNAFTQSCPQVSQYNYQSNQSNKQAAQFQKKQRKIALIITTIIVLMLTAFALNSFLANSHTKTTSTPIATTYSSSSSSYSSSSYSTLEKKTCAKLHAEAFVEKYLKSPSTAKFPNYTQYTYDLSGSTWTVSGYVDAENSFGATTRQYFIVSFTVSSDLNNATLVSIDFY